MSNISFSQDDRALLANALTEQGGILEHQAYRILQYKYPETDLKRNWVISCNGERHEIDLLFNSGSIRFVMECKHSSRYGWFFHKERRTGRQFHLIWDSSREPKLLETRSISLDSCKKSYNWDLDIADGVGEFALDQDGSLLKLEPKKGSNQKRLVPSSRDDYMRNKVRQVLYNLQYHIYEEQGYHSNVPNQSATAGYRFIPLIVTNAPMYLIEYDEEKIDKNGILSELSDVPKINWIGLNFSEVLHWNSDLRQRIEGEDKTHQKTVFCVHISKLVEFIEMFCGRTLCIKS